MTYCFKALTDAWSVIYDDLGHNETHELSDFSSKVINNLKIHNSDGLVIKILEPQNCIMYSAVRKLKIDVLVDDIKTAVNFVEEYTSTITVDKLTNKYSGVTMLCKDIGFYLSLVNGKLNAISHLQSVDGWKRFPYIATRMMIIQMLIAKKLDVKLGWHQFNCFNFYIDETNFVTDHEEYNKAMNDFYLVGKEGIPYFKYFDSRDYKITLDEILKDTDIICDENINDKYLNNECMGYLFGLNSEVK